MIEGLARRRRRRLLWLAGAAVAALGLAVLVSQPAAELRTQGGGGLAAPALASGQAQARRITITTTSSAFSVVRTPRGWVLPDRGDYPVKAEKVAALQQLLANLRLERPMTRDPAKLPRLNLGDPQAGGAGFQVQVQDEGAAYLVDLVLGVTDRGLYARKRGDTQAWAVRGEAPPTDAIADLLELRPIGLVAEDLVRLDIAPMSGPAYALLRDAPGAPLQLGRPFSARRLQDAAMAEAPALALARLQPRDVAPAPSIGGAPAARLIANSVEGLVVQADIHRQDEAYWVKITSPGVAPGAAEAVAERQRSLNAEFAPWAFALSKEAAEALAPPLSMLTGQEETELPERAGAPLPPEAPRAPVERPKPSPAAAGPRPKASEAANTAPTEPPQSAAAPVQPSAPPPAPPPPPPNEPPR